MNPSGSIESFLEGSTYLVFGHSMEDTKGSGPTCLLLWQKPWFSPLYVLKRKALLSRLHFLPWRESCGCKWADEVSRCLFLDCKQKTLSSGASNRFFPAAIHNWLWQLLNIWNMNFKTGIWRKHPSTYSEAGYVHFIPLRTNYIDQDWTTRGRCQLTSIFFPLVLKYNEGLKMRILK